MKDPLFTNKLAAAILIVLLIFIGLPVIINTFVTLASGHHGDHHFDEENPFGLAYTPYSELVGAPAAAQEEEKVSLGCLLAEADPERGKRGAGICASCHSFDQGGANGTGPALWNVVGRDIASVEGYSYSSALASMEGEWTYEKLDQYLYDSQAYVPGTQMAQKIRKDNKRADILAYLGTLTSGDPVPFPECVTSEEMAEGDTPMEEAAESAADRADFEVPGPGEAELDDSTVNTMEDVQPTASTDDEPSER
ncbi:c-type cytochrome [Parvularcula lutaonensis]|uniref:C-type cytochrome n=1 Tax=Parvularcula lutaonensis TaxID=491923 RepID=A0ABV7MAZ4_9PROT|nr:c-type cytochrome [Parvularcula lutaonensis]GGY46887.1 cytochrome c [Parvularcula lutaonensis]